MPDFAGSTPAARTNIGSLASRRVNAVGAEVGKFIINGCNYNYGINASSPEEALNRCSALAVSHRTVATLYSPGPDGKWVRHAVAGRDGSLTVLEAKREPVPDTAPSEAGTAPPETMPIEQLEG